MLKILHAIHRRIRWSIHKNDPLSFPLQILPGWSFINPLVYGDISRKNEDEGGHDLNIILDQRIVFFTHSLMFVTPPEFIFHNEEVYSILTEKFGRFFTNLRYVSKQPEIFAGASSAFILEECNELPRLKFPDAQPHATAMIVNYYVDTAVTYRHLEIADKLSEDFSPPTFDTIILDAIKSYEEGDYRRTILYAAMGVEIAAATKLDNVYETLLREETANKNFRFVSLPGGSIGLKDPIHESLSGRTDFSKLLHERPLYLLDKSLLVDNHTLYQKGMKLYRTRNKIVHMGEPPAEQQQSYFGFDSSDALEALECAFEILEWFGEDSEYVVGRRKTYQGSVPFSTAG